MTALEKVPIDILHGAKPYSTSLFAGDIYPLAANYSRTKDGRTSMRSPWTENNEMKAQNGLLRSTATI